MTQKTVNEVIAEFLLSRVDSMDYGQLKRLAKALEKRLASFGFLK